MTSDPTDWHQGACRDVLVASAETQVGADERALRCGRVVRPAKSENASDTPRAALIDNLTRGELVCHERKEHCRGNVRVERSVVRGRGAVGRRRASAVWFNG